MTGTSAPAADAAITVALAALAHLAGSDALSARFLADSGMSPGDVAAASQAPEFLAAVLDFYLSDEPSLLDFAAQAGMAPGNVVTARGHLPGGMLPHWT